MPETVTCFSCDREPTRQCSRCGRPYCDEHGEELCDICLQPGSGVPSFTLYRGSLLAMLVFGGLAIWLLIQPPSGESSSGIRPVVVTSTAVTAAAQTPAANRTPATNQTPTASQTPGANPTGTRPPGSVTPIATATPAGTAGTYLVVSGDTLSGICAAQRPTIASADCVTQVRSLNGLTGDTLNIGDRLRLP